MREFFALEQISRPHGYDVCCSDFILSTRLVDCEVRSLSSDTRADRLRFLRQWWARTCAARAIQRTDQRAC